MMLPPVIRIQASCDGSYNLSGVIFQLTVHSGTKNPYQIYLPKTDDSGVASISSDDFRGQFTDHYEVGLMDYNGTVDSADQDITVSLFNQTRTTQQRQLLTSWPLLRHERTKWHSRTEVLEYFLACRNNAFVFEPKLLTLPMDGQIHVKVTPKIA